MILNKAAVDRGLAHGTIFKTETVNLKDDKGKTQVVLWPVEVHSGQLCHVTDYVTPCHGELSRSHPFALVSGSVSARLLCRSLLPR